MPDLIVKLQASIAADTLLPRDRFVITPHFRVTEVPVAEEYDGNGLCQDLADGLSSIFSGTGATREVSVKSYDAQGAPPVYPNGEGIANEGAAPGSLLPRELALCLSFYAQRNVPRQRGRLYIPVATMNTIGTPGVRPSTAYMNQVLAFHGLLEGLGGLNVDWVVYSRRDNVARPVTTAWCDDEWDIQRRRGLRPTTRVTASSSG